MTHHRGGPSATTNNKKCERFFFIFIFLKEQWTFWKKAQADCFTPTLGFSSDLVQHGGTAEGAEGQRSAAPVPEASPPA